MNEDHDDPHEMRDMLAKLKACTDEISTLAHQKAAITEQLAHLKWQKRSLDQRIRTLRRGVPRRGVCPVCFRSPNVRRSDGMLAKHSDGCPGGGQRPTDGVPTLGLIMSVSDHAQFPERWKKIQTAVSTRAAQPKSPPQQGHTGDKS